MRTFNLLLYKNLLVRMRHWKTGLFLQSMVPIALFVLLQTVRDFSVQPRKVINESTYYPIETKEELTGAINRELTFIYYVPQNEYTENIMESTRVCLEMPSSSRCCFLNFNFLIILFCLFKIR